MTGTFKAYNLSEKMIASLNRQGYLTPSKVQDLVIPKALKGKNIVCKSETGSGKTHAFLIPILNLIDKENVKDLYSIIIAPTNELARQIFNFARGFKKEFGDIKIRLFTSETSEKENISNLKEIPNLIVATPGRLKSLIEHGHLNISNIKCLVVDEADMLFDLGYSQEISYIMSLLNNAQIMVFSATIKENLQHQLIKYIGADYEITNDNTGTNKSVKHFLIDIHHHDINECAYQFIKIKNPYFLLIFASSKVEVNDLYQYLKNKKIKVIQITGDMSDRERKAAFRRINNDEFQIVVASDLVSRGIDFKNISDVLSVNLPMDLIYYFHRAGRTGRFDQKGDSYVFYNPGEEKKILNLINQGINFEFLSLKENTLLPTKNKIIVEHKKKKIDENLAKEINKAKYETRGKKVKPNYKKKVKLAVAKVKQKHKREMIKKDIRKQRVERYKQEARMKKL